MSEFYEVPEISEINSFKNLEVPEIKMEIPKDLTNSTELKELETPDLKTFNLEVLDAKIYIRIIEFLDNNKKFNSDYSYWKIEDYDQSDTDLEIWIRKLKMYILNEIKKNLRIYIHPEVFVDFCKKKFSHEVCNRLSEITKYDICLSMKGMIFGKIREYNVLKTGYFTENQIHKLNNVIIHLENLNMGDKMHNLDLRNLTNSDLTNLNQPTLIDINEQERYQSNLKTVELEDKKITINTLIDFLIDRLYESTSKIEILDIIETFKQTLIEEKQYLGSIDIILKLLENQNIDKLIEELCKYIQRPYIHKDMDFFISVKENTINTGFDDFENLKIEDLLSVLIGDLTELLELNSDKFNSKTTIYITEFLDNIDSLGLELNEIKECLACYKYEEGRFIGDEYDLFKLIDALKHFI